MFKVTTKQQTNYSSFAGTLDLILSRNNSKTYGRNHESRVTKDCLPYIAGREMTG